MTDVQKLNKYLPSSISIEETYTCTLNPAGPIVGFKVAVSGSRYRLYIRALDMLNYIKEKGSVDGIEVFNASSRDGLVLHPDAFRSSKKKKSLTSGEHVVNINHLQKATWEGIIDPKNKVQCIFTSLV